MADMEVDSAPAQSEFSIGAFAKGKGKESANTNLGTDAKMEQARDGLPWLVCSVLNVSVQLIAQGGEV